MECFPNLSGLWMHLSIPSGIGIWKRGGIFKKKKKAKLPSITFKLTSQSFTANWAIWLQFKVLYWLNKPEPLKCLTKLLPKTAWEYSHGILFIYLFFWANPVHPDHRWVKNAAKHLLIFFYSQKRCTFCLLHYEYRLRLKRGNCKCGHTLLALLLGNADWSVGTLAWLQHPHMMALGTVTPERPHHCTTALSSSSSLSSSAAAAAS